MRLDKLEKRAQNFQNHIKQNCYEIEEEKMLTDVEEKADKHFGDKYENEIGKKKREEAESDHIHNKIKWFLDGGSYDRMYY